MPSTRPRCMITESDWLSEGLTRAGELWPGASHDKGQLLKRIVDGGVERALQETAARSAERAETIHRVAGSLRGVWPPTWRHELRDEWPA